MSSLLTVDRLTRRFNVPGGEGLRAAQSFVAADVVSFSIERGETLGLVGESGSGKTTIGRCILRLIEPTGGKVEFDGVDMVSLNGAALRSMRRNVQMIFQDPFASLNPRLKVGRIVAEPMQIHGLLADRRSRRARVRALLDEVGLPAGAEDRYPHEFSGGQRQRIGIARALAAEPKLIIADEPVSALDVSVQAQVLNLLSELRARHGLTMLLISHDLELVRYLCDRIVVLYAGRVMESGPADEVTSRPAHPYTRALISAIPSRNPLKQRERIILRGELPNPVNPPSGCIFRTRCPHAVPACAVAKPELRSFGPGRLVACSNDAALPVLAGAGAV